MRAICSLLLIVGFVGCRMQEYPAKSESTSQTSEDECPGCNECSVAKNRANLLKNSKETPPPELKPGEQIGKEFESHKGKVVCVYVWGSIHQLSIKKLPMLVELQKKYANGGLVCLTACYAPSGTHRLAANLLTNAKSDLTSFAIDDEMQTIAGEKIWQGLALPAAIVYGRDGSKIATFSSRPGGPAFEFAAIEQTIEKALAVKPQAK